MKKKLKARLPPGGESSRDKEPSPQAIKMTNAQSKMIKMPMKCDNCSDVCDDSIQIAGENAYLCDKCYESDKDSYEEKSVKASNEVHVIVANYYIDSRFEVPIGIKILSVEENDSMGKEDVVGAWWIKWNVFYYVDADKTVKSVEPIYEAECDFKRPSGVEIYEDEASN